MDGRCGAERGGGIGKDDVGRVADALEQPAAIGLGDLADDRVVAHQRLRAGVAMTFDQLRAALHVGEEQGEDGHLHSMPWSVGMTPYTARRPFNAVP